MVAKNWKFPNVVNNQMGSHHIKSIQHKGLLLHETA